MIVKTDLPQIAAVRLATEEKFGHPVDSRADFTSLALEIERITGEHIAENTLRRLWGRMEPYETIFSRTLDVLSRYCGFEHWSAFCDTLKTAGGRESDIAKTGMAIKAEDLKEGDRIRIGWLPDRLCIVEYMGGRTFKAVECNNSTMQAGDTFECSVMIKGYPLFVDNMVHSGEILPRYMMGLRNGLVTLEKV